MRASDIPTPAAAEPASANSAAPASTGYSAATQGYDDSEFVIEVKKDNRSLGVDVDYKQLELVIGLIREGLVQDWNNSNPDKQVHVQDSIIAVNNVYGQPGLGQDR